MKGNVKMKTAEFKGTFKGKPISRKGGDGRRADFPATDGAAVQSEWRHVPVNMRKADYDRIKDYCREKGQGVSPFMRYAAVLYLDLLTKDNPAGAR
jgi:hypothetical protein